jgi:hypothetical protein
MRKDGQMEFISSIRSRDSLVGIATCYGLGDQGVRVRVPVWSRIFSSSHLPDRLCSPPKLLYSGYKGALSPGVKWQVREADHSHPTSAEVKKRVNLYIHSPVRLHGVVLN